MHSLLVWVMLATQPGMPVPHFTYPTQTDCLRAKSKIESVRQQSIPYRCVSFTITDPRLREIAPKLMTHPSMQSNGKALRNYHYEQNKIAQFLSSYNVPQGKLHGQRQDTQH